MVERKSASENLIKAANPSVNHVLLGQIFHFVFSGPAQFESVCGRAWLVERRVAHI